MKNKFEVVVNFSAMNELLLYERLRNAIFDWQTGEPKVKSVTVLPINKDAQSSPNKRKAKICPYAAVLKLSGKSVCINDGEDCTGEKGVCVDWK